LQGFADKGRFLLRQKISVPKQKGASSVAREALFVLPFANLTHFGANATLPKTAAFACDTCALEKSR